MLTIILLIAGIAISIKKSVGVSKHSEIRRPNTYIMGAVLILLAIILQILSGVELFDGANIVVGFMIGIIIIPFIAVVLLKQPKLTEDANPIQDTTK